MSPEERAKERTRDILEREPWKKTLTRTCVCGATFDEKKDYYKHMAHMRCNEVDKPRPKRMPKQLSLFGGK